MSGAARSSKSLFGAVVKVAGLVLIALFFVGLWSMSGSHAYHQQSLVYLDTAKQVLIAHGVCQNPNDCVKKRVLFGDGGAVKFGPFEFGGVNIQVYGVSNPNVVGDLVKGFGEIYKQQRGPRLRLDVYETKHQESKRRLAKVLIE
jgi:hypothetical protein